MEHKLYRKLEEGEVIKAGDLLYRSDLGEYTWMEESALWANPIAGNGWIRPVESDSANRKPDDSSPVVGIPLRAYFAGLAMQGLISSIPEGKQGTPELIADLSVQCADALIAALEGKEGE